jgi:tyrosinase
MTLSGPDNLANQLVENDDGGVGLSSRISMNLSAGNYTVRVRLFNSSVTGNYSIGVNLAPAGPVIPTLIVNGPVVDAAISAGNESDLYSFQAQSQGTYVIETSGPTDTFLSVFGPGSQTNLIAQNDDGGFRLNSLISRSLAGGEYFVRVRHFSPQGTGSYQVSVRRV